MNIKAHFGLLLIIIIGLFRLTASSDKIKQQNNLRRIKSEAMKISKYADTILIPFQLSSKLFQNDTSMIHEMIKNMQKFSDDEYRKRIFISESI
ncbi:hypothetical protein BLOT_001595 [Blomia tropicalis]|nr:hypothetical protein BLOT_001595 [Blomia tropicalis]